MQKNQSLSGNPVPVETSSTVSPRSSRDELRALGKSLREKCPRSDHSIWEPAEHRRDPVALIEESNQGRMPQLIPIRHGRMLQSPFAFYRGSALNMAADLAGTPTSGIRVQACGDCHLMNFGAFATPERRVIFDINDLDETLSAPWEWDLKRLAASFVLACRDNGLSEDDARDAVLSCARSYREHMAEYSRMSVLEVWYASIDVDTLMETIKDEETVKRMQKRLAKAREHSVLEHDFPQLATTAGLAPTIRDNPPLIFHPQEQEREELMSRVHIHFAQYRETLQADRRLLLDRFQLVDAALKVVGVGSVGTYCAILLLMASEDDPLFLQVKQARPSVLEAYAGASPHVNQGERIVHGCRMMQSANDIFLGWVEGEAGRHFYIRQLRDMKIKPMVEVFTAAVMREYAELCGWAVAHAHGRSGEPTKISGYLGKNDSFDKAIADFSKAYADQTERDYEVLRNAARAGKLEVEIEGQ
ncbi:hypothetical protein ETAA8_40830 [Anatilimnocola aggregata]|uniref:DUF2252 domain-containing protein n=1 Tax=Anatilimnocola aggregata TaxID=2528021 RepID=A0A517YFG5_9BACT|nr:DUF2252 domain-containing protein [Anatilimnocola aggregata]QDU28977.1 hypothetical protein ETAA8_40830 [Anatilimnocola aggregata]